MPERKERRKLEEEILRVEQRMSTTLRRRNKSLEVGNQRSRDEEVEELRAMPRATLHGVSDQRGGVCQMSSGQARRVGPAAGHGAEEGSVGSLRVVSHLVARVPAPARGIGQAGPGPGATAPGRSFEHPASLEQQRRRPARGVRPTAGDDVDSVIAASGVVTNRNGEPPAGQGR